MRFTQGAAGTTSVSFSNLLDTMLMATTTTSGTDLFDLVKIKSVRVWAQSALGTPASVAVQFNTATGDRELYQDTSLGVRPAFIHAKPSAKSLASFFQQSTAGDAFTVTAPAGSILDIKLVFRTTDATPTTTGQALVSAMVGELYYRGLDGLPSASTNLPPPAGVPTR